MIFVNRDITKEERKEIYDDFIKIEIQDGVPQAESNRYSYVAEDKGTVIGFASGLTNHKWFVLTNLWVHSDYRRKKLGSKLLIMLEEKVMSIHMEHIYLWTYGFFAPAFFEKHDYNKFAVFENFFEVKGNHYIGYRKDLNYSAGQSTVHSQVNAKITDREITKQELQDIDDDFTKIEIQDGVPQVKQERHSFVAEENDTVICYASGLTDHKWFYLSDLWVHEDYRRQGLGAKSLKMLEDKIKSAGIEHIYTWTTGVINTKFYESQGYKQFVLFEDFCGVDGYHRTGYRKDLI